jgi:hypothetical protein
VTAAWAVSAAAWVEAAVSTAAVAVAIAVVAVVRVVSAVVQWLLWWFQEQELVAPRTLPLPLQEPLLLLQLFRLPVAQALAFVGGGGEVVSGVVAGVAGIRFVDEEGVWSCGCSVTGWGVGSGCVEGAGSVDGDGFGLV